MKKLTIEGKITKIINQALEAAEIKSNEKIEVEDNHSFKVITHHTSLDLEKQTLFFNNIQEFLGKHLKIWIDEDSMAIAHYPLILVIALNIHY